MSENWIGRALRIGVVGQFTRYAVVGLVSNATLYLLYLAVTALGVAPKVAMTVLYGLIVLQTFIFNKRWSFRDRGPEGAALVRYCIAYASGYVLNFLILTVFVDRLGFAHQYVQGVAILLIAVYLFLLQRIWVYRHQRRADFRD
jgi:putative flippase GtrA